MQETRHHPNSSPNQARPTDPPPSDDEIRNALKAVLKSADFDGVARLQSFLQYVVDEYLAGRGEAISSKTIAEDVYGRKLNHGDDPLAIVRVDAGRLRRRLAAYYDHEGHHDTLRIRIDPGGYCPRFEATAPQPPDSGSVGAPHGDDTHSRGLWMWLGIGLVSGIAITVVAFWLMTTPRSENPDTEAVISGGIPENADELREALFRVSPAKLQASNLAKDGRDLMFPALDRARLVVAFDLFEHAIFLDPDYFGGHAGAAQINAILSLTETNPDKRVALLAQARMSSDRALAVAPSEGWAHSAHALTAYAGKECEAASSSSSQARRLGPDDVHVMNFHALIALFCGENQLAIETSKAWVDDTRSSTRLAFRNALVAAHFNLGQHEAAIDNALIAIRAGGPVSPLNVAYLTAAYIELGDAAAAKESLALLNRAWPGYPLDAVVRNLYVDPAWAEMLVDALKRAGWKRGAK